MPLRGFVFAAHDPTYKRFDIFPPLTEGCSEGLDAFNFFFKQQSTKNRACRTAVLLLSYTLFRASYPTTAPLYRYVHAHGKWRRFVALLWRSGRAPGIERMGNGKFPRIFFREILGATKPSTFRESTSSGAFMAKRWFITDSFWKHGTSAIRTKTLSYVVLARLGALHCRNVWSSHIAIVWINRVRFAIPARGQLNREN